MHILKTTVNKCIFIIIIYYYYSIFITTLFYNLHTFKGGLQRQF